MSTSCVHREVDGPVGWVEIRRPSKKNAIDSATANAISDAVLSLAAEPSVCAVVLSGQGGDLSTGADTGEPLPAGPWRDTAHARLLRQVRTSGIPIVAAVDGWALGLGAALVGACTYAVAAESARFGFPESALGWFPTGAVPNLLRRVRPDVVVRWALSAETLDGREAATHGLVTDVVAHGAALGGARTLARRLSGPGRQVVTHGMAWLREWEKHNVHPFDRWCEDRMSFDRPPSG